MPVIKSREYKDISRLEMKIEYTFTQKFKGSKEQIDAAMRRIEPFLFTLYNGGEGVNQNDLSAIAKDMRGQVEQLQKRKGCTYYGENFLNFSGQDFDLGNHSPENVNFVKYAMADLARKWVEIRGISTTTWVARPHFDTDNAHVHILYSKNERDQKKRVHLTRAQFLKAQNELNEYQRTHYPTLQHTFEKKIEPKKRQRSLQIDRQRIMQKKNRLPTIRRHLSEVVKNIIPTVNSLGALSASAKANGFSVYERGGIPYGIQQGERHFRFSTLLKGTAYDNQIEVYIEEARQLAKARKRLNKTMKKLKDRQRGYDRNLERDL